MNLTFHFHYSSDRSTRTGLASFIISLLIATQFNRLHAKDVNEQATKDIDFIKFNSTFDRIVRNISKPRSTDGPRSHLRLNVSKSQQMSSVIRPTEKQEKCLKTESFYIFKKEPYTEGAILNRLPSDKKTGSGCIPVTCPLPYSKANKECTIESHDLTVGATDLNYDRWEISQKNEKNDTILSSQREFQNSTSGKIPILKSSLPYGKVIGKREIFPFKFNDRKTKVDIVLSNAENLMDAIIHPSQKDDGIDNHQLGNFKLQLAMNHLKRNMSSRNYEITINVSVIGNDYRLDSDSSITLKGRQEKNDSEIGQGVNENVNTMQIRKPAIDKIGLAHYQKGKYILLESQMTPNIINRIRIKQEKTYDSGVGKQKTLVENRKQLSKTVRTTKYNLTLNIAQPRFANLKKIPVNEITLTINRNVTNVKNEPTKQSKFDSDVMTNDEITESYGNVTTVRPDLIKRNKLKMVIVNSSDKNDSEDNKACHCTKCSNKNEEKPLALETKYQNLGTTASTLITIFRPYREWVLSTKSKHLAIGRRKTPIRAITNLDEKENVKTKKRFHGKTFTTEMYSTTPNKLPKDNAWPADKKNETVYSCDESPEEEMLWNAKVLKTNSPILYGLNFNKLYSRRQPVNFRNRNSARKSKRPAEDDEELTSTVRPNKRCPSRNKVVVESSCKLPGCTTEKLRLTTINPDELVFVGKPHRKKKVYH